MYKNDFFISFKCLAIVNKIENKIKKTCSYAENTEAMK